MLGRIRNQSAAHFGGRAPDLEASFRRFQPDDATPWVRPPRDGALLTLCLIPCPGLFHYAGGFGGVLPVGQLTSFPRGMLYSAVNFGQVTAVHLEIVLKAKTDDTGPAESSDGETDAEA